MFTTGGVSIIRHVPYNSSGRYVQSSLSKIATKSEWADVRANQVFDDQIQPLLIVHVGNTGNVLPYQSCVDSSEIS